MSHQENNNSSFGISTQVEDVERKFRYSSATPLEPLLIIVSFILTIICLLTATHTAAISLATSLHPIGEHWKNTVIFGDYLGIAFFGGATLVKLFRWFKNPGHLWIKEAIFTYARYYLVLWVKITTSIFLVVAFVAFVFDKPAVF